MWPNTDKFWDSLTQASFGIASEAGELAGIMEKCVRKNLAPNTDEIIDEVGDLLYYIARLLDTFDCTFEQAFEKNRIKLDYRKIMGKNKEEERKLQREGKVGD